MTGKVELLQDSCLWNSDYLDQSSPLSVEDSGIDSDPKQRLASILEDDKLFPASDSSCSSHATIYSPHKSNAKHLQKKLEQKIEQAKKIQRMQDYKKNTTLIPIQRLPIPNKLSSNITREQQPLVDWETDESEEEEAIDFFPLTRLKSGEGNSGARLTDTFSLEDYEVSGAEDEDDDLNLTPPGGSAGVGLKGGPFLAALFCCWSNSEKASSSSSSSGHCCIF